MPWSATTDGLLNCCRAASISTGFVVQHRCVAIVPSHEHSGPLLGRLFSGDIGVPVDTNPMDFSTFKVTGEEVQHQHGDHGLSSVQGTRAKDPGAE
jgi:hypothetical protein